MYDDSASWPATVIRSLAPLALACALCVPAVFAQEAGEYDDEPQLEAIAQIDDSESFGEADDSIPWEQRQAMEAPLRERASKLRDEKNSAGIKNRIGRYSKKFRKVDDDTYTVTFTESTAHKFRLQVDRYLLTLGRESGDTWKIVDEELRDTFDGMTRSWIVAQFVSFDGFEIEREGLRVTGGAGQLYPQYHEGKLEGVYIVAEGIEQSYAPPSDITIDYYDKVYDVWTERFKKKLDFKVNSMEIGCDPESCAEILASFRGLGELVPPDDSSEDWESDEADASVSSEIREAFNDEVRRANKLYREYPFAGFRPPNEVGNRYWQIQLKKSDNAWFAVTYNNYSPEEVRVVGYFRGVFAGTLFSYFSEDTRKAGIDPYELERRPDRQGRYYHLTSVKGEVEAALDDPEVYEAKIDYGIEVTRDLTQKLLPFFIATVPAGEDEERKNPSLTVNLVEYEGEELTVVRTGAFSGLIVLPDVVEAGEAIDLRMEFSSKAISKINHAFSSMYRGGWLPFVRFGDQIDEFELTIKVPEGYTTLGVGRMTDEKNVDGVNVTHWVADNPVAFPTIIFGKYTAISSDDVFEAKKEDGTPIPITVHVDEVSMGTLEIDIASYNDAQSFSEDIRAGARGIRAKQLKPIGVQAATAVDYYTKISGIEYPYGELNLVNDPAPALYGQAPSSLIYLGSMVFRGEGTMASDTVMGGGGASTAKFLKSVTAHEVAHQWWGSAIANANGRNYWFVESLAEFFSALWLEQAFGRKEYLEQVDEWRRRILDIEQFASVQRSQGDWSGESPGAAYQALVYNKGPYAFHILRSTFGDEKFFPFLKKFCQELHQMGEIVTLDIQRVAEEALGGVDANGNPYKVDLGWFFDQWIRGVGVPEYSIIYETRKNEEGNWIIEGTVRQRVVMGNQRNKVEMPKTYYRGVVPITVLGKKGREYQKRLVVEGPESPFTLLVPERPTEIILNKDGEILAHDVLENRPFGS